MKLKEHEKGCLFVLETRKRLGEHIKMQQISNFDDLKAWHCVNVLLFDPSHRHHHHQIFQEIFIVNLFYARAYATHCDTESRNILSAFMGLTLQVDLWTGTGNILEMFYWKTGDSISLLTPIVTLQRWLPFPTIKHDEFILSVLATISYFGVYILLCLGGIRKNKCGKVGYYLWKEIKYRILKNEK